jgi:hypothetical protein
LPLLVESSGLLVEAAGSLIEAQVAELSRVDALFAQRAVADRVVNPHGEHAENTWQARARARRAGFG